MTLVTPPEGSYPLAEFFGIEPVHDQDRMGCRITINENHLNPHGVVHGGVLFTMVDQAMGMAAYQHLAPNQICTTLEIHIRYLKPVSEGVIEVLATVLNQGRRIVQLEAKATAGGRVVGAATGSFVVLTLPETPAP